MAAATAALPSSSDSESSSGSAATDSFADSRSLSSTSTPPTALPPPAAAAIMGHANSLPTLDGASVKKASSSPGSPTIVLHDEDIIVSRPPTPPPLPSLSAIMRAHEGAAQSPAVQPKQEERNDHRISPTGTALLRRLDVVEQASRAALNTSSSTIATSQKKDVPPPLQLLQSQTPSTSPPPLQTPTFPASNGGDAAVVGNSAAATPTPDGASSKHTPRRTGRARASDPVYNLARLSGTDGHGKREAKGDTILHRRPRKNGSVGGAAGSSTAGTPTAASAQMATPGAADPDVGTEGDSAAARHEPESPSVRKREQRASAGGPSSSPKKAVVVSHSAGRRRSAAAAVLHETRSSRSPKKPAATRVSARISSGAGPASGQNTPTKQPKPPPPAKVLGKRKGSGGGGGGGGDVGPAGESSLSRELRRLRDTNEFAHIDTAPIVYTVWSNGKYVPVTRRSGDASEPARKKLKAGDENKVGGSPSKSAKADEDKAAEPVVVEPPKKKAEKKWLDRGLYAGQKDDTFPYMGLGKEDNKRLKTHFQGLLPKEKPNKLLPLPMFAGLRVLLYDRDFKLPYDVCNPLPPGQPKPEDWRKMQKNRFVGDSVHEWKKTKLLEDSMSKCVCTPLYGCDEDCQNRIMLYECDDTNCNVGRERCGNRAFADLQDRTSAGGKYRIGVEVLKTKDRGFGVRANRCFEPGQIIMEYTGEIITLDECERRMNEVYKNNACYYLMSFDQNMIIDATTGSIARFVNHSCRPNCRMVKWIVSGQPRMALFAGDGPITTGEELTYDYNFDPFSAKNVQKCLCGSDNCRGVLGPKTKSDSKAAAAAKKDEAAKSKGAKSAGGKRKRAADDDDDERPKKKGRQSPKKKKKTAAAAAAAAAVSPARAKQLVKQAAAAKKKPALAKTPPRKRLLATTPGRRSPGATLQKALALKRAAQMAKKKKKEASKAAAAASPASKTVVSTTTTTTTTTTTARGRRVLVKADPPKRLAPAAGRKRVIFKTPKARAMEQQQQQQQSGARVSGSGGSSVATRKASSASTTPTKPARVAKPTRRLEQAVVDMSPGDGGSSSNLTRAADDDDGGAVTATAAAVAVVASGPTAAVSAVRKQAHAVLAAIGKTFATAHHDLPSPRSSPGTTTASTDRGAAAAPASMTTTAEAAATAAAKGRALRQSKLRFFPLASSGSDGGNDGADDAMDVDDDFKKPSATTANTATAAATVVAKAAASVAAAAVGPAVASAAVAAVTATVAAGQQDVDKTRGGGDSVWEVPALG